MATANEWLLYSHGKYSENRWILRHALKTDKAETEGHADADHTTFQEITGHQRWHVSILCFNSSMKLLYCITVHI